MIKKAISINVDNVDCIPEVRSVNPRLHGRMVACEIPSQDLLKVQKWALDTNATHLYLFTEKIRFWTNKVSYTAGAETETAQSSASRSAIAASSGAPISPSFKDELVAFEAVSRKASKSAETNKPPNASAASANPLAASTTQSDVASTEARPVKRALPKPTETAGRAVSLDQPATSTPAKTATSTPAKPAKTINDGRPHLFVTMPTTPKNRKPEPLFSKEALAKLDIENLSDEDAAMDDVEQGPKQRSRSASASSSSSSASSSASEGSNASNAPEEDANMDDLEPTSALADFSTKVFLDKTLEMLCSETGLDEQKPSEVVWESSQDKHLRLLGSKAVLDPNPDTMLTLQSSAGELQGEGKALTRPIRACTKARRTRS